MLPTFLLLEPLVNKGKQDIKPDTIPRIRIQLPFTDPEEYTFELLSKLLSRIMNPDG